VAEGVQEVLGAVKMGTTGPRESSDPSITGTVSRTPGRGWWRFRTACSFVISWCEEASLRSPGPAKKMPVAGLFRPLRRKMQSYFRKFDSFEGPKKRTRRMGVTDDGNFLAASKPPGLGRVRWNPVRRYGLHRAHRLYRQARRKAAARKGPGCGGSPRYHNGMVRQNARSPRSLASYPPAAM